MNDLNPGDKVICIDAKPSHPLQNPMYIVEGQEYTVTKNASPSKIDGRPRVLLKGVPVAYWNKRFRKVDITGMNLLRELLADPEREIQGPEEPKRKKEVVQAKQKKLVEWAQKQKKREGA